MRNEEKQFYDDMMRDCVSAYAVGSKMLGFINNVRDEDYLFLFDDEDLCKRYRESYRLYRRGLAERHEPHTVDFHIKYIGTYVRIEIITAYQQKFFKLIKGEDILDVDVLDEKDRYFAAIKKFVERQETLKTHGDQKFWYHVYLGLSILDNESYDLTDEQKENVNILHDKTPGERRDELIAWCKNKLGVEAPIEKQKEAE